MESHINEELAHLPGYYRIPQGQPHPDIINNIEDNRCYLRVNCAGRCIIPCEFLRYQPHGREDYYLMYLYGGTLSVYIGDIPEDEHLLLTPGQLFIFPPHITFRYENAGTAPICYLWAHATGYGTAGLLADCALPIGTPLSVGHVSEAEEKFKGLFKTLLLHEPFFDITAASQFMELCAMFGRALARERENTKGHRDPMDSVTARDNIRRIYTSLSYLHENLSQPISVPFLAEMEHLGVSRYRTLFHAATGMSPIAYLTDLRMKRAAEILMHTELSVADVALSVGYEDPQYFSRVFRQHWQVSPAVYASRRKTERPTGMSSLP